MAVRVGINGFDRIGTLTTKAAMEVGTSRWCLRSTERRDRVITAGSTAERGHESPRVVLSPYLETKYVAVNLCGREVAESVRVVPCKIERTKDALE